MKAINLRSSRVKASKSKKEKTSSPRPLQDILTDAEREVLLKACRKYRCTIPGYIKSKQPEIHAVDAIIQKLS